MYPILIRISTPDGDGECRKAAAGEPWSISVPTRDFRYYGSAPEMRAEVRRRLRVDYPNERHPVSFANTEE